MKPQSRMRMTYNYFAQPIWLGKNAICWRFDISSGLPVRHVYGVVLCLYLGYSALDCKVSCYIEEVFGIGPCALWI